MNSSCHGSDRSATGLRYPMQKIAIIDLFGGDLNSSIAAIEAHATANRTEADIFDGIHGRLPKLKHFSAYIVSDGSAGPTASEPWRVRLQAALPAYAKTRPVFGIGLGFQLMAAAYGWPVRPLPHPRSGVFPLTPTPAGWSDPLMRDLENATPVVEHRSWAVLDPPAAIRTGARVLAYSNAGDVAAARFTDRSAGTIFQPERKTAGAASTVLGHFVKLAVEST